MEYIIETIKQEYDFRFRKIYLVHNYNKAKYCYTKKELKEYVETLIKGGEKIRENDLKKCM